MIVMFQSIKILNNFLANKRKALLPEHEAEMAQAPQENRKNKKNKNTGNENQEYRDDYYDQRNKGTIF